MEITKEHFKSLNFNYPQYIPSRVNLLPAVWKKYRESLKRLISKFPGIFEKNQLNKVNFDEVTGTYIKGKHKDAWDCVWENKIEGMEAVVTENPISKRRDIHNLEPPKRNLGLPHGFMFLRLIYLRGYENLMIDFAEEPPELQKLIDIVLDYNLKQLKKIIQEKSNQKILFFGDDLGMQNNLPISPKKWNKYLKPCYKKLFKISHEKGYYVYFHSDGHIHEIIPDLIESGVDIINPQIRANGLNNLVKKCKGKVCVDLDLDRQMFPVCSPKDIHKHIKKAVKKMGSAAGGLWLYAACSPDVPLENIEAICKALKKYKFFFSENI